MRGLRTSDPADSTYWNRRAEGFPRDAGAGSFSGSGTLASEAIGALWDITVSRLRIAKARGKRAKWHEEDGPTSSSFAERRRRRLVYTAADRVGREDDRGREDRGVGR